MSVEPESAHALTGAYVLDALDADEAEAFEAHLEVCEYCRAEVASLRSAVEHLPALTPVAVPPGLRADVLGAIATVRPLPPLPQPHDTVAPASPLDELAAARVRREATRGWRLVAAAAAVVAVAGVGWGALRDTDPLTREVVAVEQTADPDLLALLQSPDLVVIAGEEDTGVSGTILRSASQDTAAMLVRDLPELPDDLVYQLWTIVGANPASAGVLDIQDGGATVVIEGGVTSADAMAVTVEPAGGSDTPTGDLVLQLSVPDA